MSDMNVVVMSGRLTRDPVRRSTPKGTPVAALRIASDQWWGGEKHPVFVDVDAFGRTAEVVTTYFRKGDPILVRGQLDLDEWTAKDGTRRSKHRIFAQQVSFFSKRGGRPSSGDVQIADGDEALPGEAEMAEIPF